MNIHERGERRRQANQLQKAKEVDELADDFAATVLDLADLLFPHDEEKLVVDDVPLGYAKHVLAMCRAMVEGTPVNIVGNAPQPHPRNNHMGNRVPATPPTPPAPDTPPATPPTPPAATPPPLSPLPPSARRTDEGILARWRRR